MERGIKDEAFIGHALDIADRDSGRWIGNQAHFNGRGNEPLAPTVQAALVTAVSVYVNKGMLCDDDLKDAS
jgi:hypothetical protein